MKKDTFQIEGVGPDGSLYGTRRHNGKETPSVVRVIEEGRPLMPGGELMEATHRRGSNELELRPMEEVSKGPAKVTSSAYRKNFDKVFGNGKKLN